jgi:hypothetical protein
MSDKPFDLKVTKDDILAAMARDDYAWLVDNVFTPALAQFMRKKNTNALINNPRPRSRRPVTRHHRTMRSDRFRP